MDLPNFCYWYDGPVSLWSATLGFAGVALVAAWAGWLRGSKIRAIRAAGTIILSVVVLASIYAGWKTLGWGLVWSAATCVPFERPVSVGAIVALNAIVIAAAWLAKRARDTRRA